MEQAGLIYKIDPQYIATPNTTEGLRLFVNSLDNLTYVKKSDGTIELFSDFIGAVQAQNVTYVELLAKKNSSTLLIGGVYRITDFRTRYIIPNTAVVDFGPIEPLIVIASNVDQIARLAVSSLYPQDEIYYEIIDTTTAGGDRGRIYFRKDTLINVNAGYDWRVVKFRRWETFLGSGIFTVLTDNGFAFQDYFTFNNSSSAADCFNTSLLEITEFGINTFGAPTNKLNNFILNGVCFNNLFNTDCFDNTITTDTIGANVVQPAFLQNTITGGEFVDNVIAPAFVGNTIGSDFMLNRIGFQFFGNTIGNFFQGNLIGNNTFGNIIGNNFERNIVRDDFAINVVGNDFEDNLVGSQAQGNIIGNNFSVNQLFTKFQNNIIEDNFVSNIIGGAFDGNINIHNDFRRNQIGQGLSGIDFDLATHVYADYDKIIFKNSAFAYRLSYVDGADAVIYTAVNA